MPARSSITLTVLGRWSPYPPAGGACPGYLVEADGARILLDCGSGVVANLHRFCSAFDLTAAVITHLHSDHFSDIYSLRMELAFGRYPQPPAPPLELFAPADAVEYLPACFPKPESRQEFLSAFTFRPLEEGSGQVGPIALRFVKTSHPELCHAVELQSRGRRLVYTADTGPSGPLEQLAHGADLLLSECSLSEDTGDLAIRLGHLTGSMAGAMARRAGVRRLLLTHFNPRQVIKESHAAATKEFGDVRVAEEGVTYDV